MKKQVQTTPAPTHRAKRRELDFIDSVWEEITDLTYEAKSAYDQQWRNEHKFDQ